MWKTKKEVRVLYFEGCPNHPPVTDLILEVADELGVDVNIEEIHVAPGDDVDRLRFFGSPTVQIDGIDVEPSARTRTDYAYSCRTYDGAGHPTRGMIAKALLGEEPRFRRKGLAAAGGSVVAATAASACCWVPLLAVALGFSTGGAAVFFAQWRHEFLFLAITLLAVAYYTTYFRRDKSPCCGEAACDPEYRRVVTVSTVSLWIATAMVVALVFFPKWGHILLEDGKGAASGAESSHFVRVGVEGMHCQACAAHLGGVLESLPEVVRAEVNYSEASAGLWLDPQRPVDEEKLKKTAEQAGYTITP